MLRDLGIESGRNQVRCQKCRGVNKTRGLIVQLNTGSYTVVHRALPGNNSSPTLAHRTPAVPVHGLPSTALHPACMTLRDKEGGEWTDLERRRPL